MEHEASLTRKIRRNRLHLHLSDLAEDRNFGEAQLLGFPVHNEKPIRKGLVRLARGNLGDETRRKNVESAELVSYVLIPGLSRFDLIRYYGHGLN